jgi:hypothetical protein
MYLLQRVIIQEREELHTSVLYHKGEGKSYGGPAIRAFLSIHSFGGGGREGTQCNTVVCSGEGYHVTDISPPSCIVKKSLSYEEHRYYPLGCDAV